jgi:regulatory protein
MIDDAKFARDWVEQRGAARPASQRTRKAELAHFGVQSDIVDEALAADEASDDLSLARAAISKWHRGISVSPSDTEALRDWTRRAISFLQRRGFSWDIVRTVVAERFGADVGGDAGEYGRDTQ